MGKSDFSHVGVTKRQPRQRPKAVRKGAALFKPAFVPREEEEKVHSKKSKKTGTAQSKKKTNKKKKKKLSSVEATPKPGPSTASAAEASSNWAKLQNKLGLASKKKTKNKKGGASEADSSLKFERREKTPLRHFADPKKKVVVVKKKLTEAGTSTGGGRSAAGKRYLNTSVEFPVPRVAGPPTDVLAIDCEMVGVGPTGETSALARVSIVNSHCQVVYDTFVRPPEKITDFRTRWSGVTAENLRGARTFKKCQEEVSKLLENRIVVGHAVGNDFDALLLSHPKTMVRDTAHYRPLMRQRGKGARFRPKALRKLAGEIFGMHEFQQDDAGHDSIDDAAMAMQLYLLHQHAWEKNLSKVTMRMEKYKAKKRAALERRKEEKKRVRTRGTGGSAEMDEEDALFGFE